MLLIRELGGDCSAQCCHGDWNIVLAGKVTTNTNPWLHSETLGPAALQYSATDCRLQTALQTAALQYWVFICHNISLQLARQGMEVLILYGVESQWSSTQLCSWRVVLDTWFKQILTNIETDNQLAWDHLCQEHRVNFGNNNIQSLRLIYCTGPLALPPSQLQ